MPEDSSRNKEEHKSGVGGGPAGLGGAEKASKVAETGFMMGGAAGELG